MQKQIIILSLKTSHTLEREKRDWEARLKTLIMSRTTCSQLYFQWLRLARKRDFKQLACRLQHWVYINILVRHEMHTRFHRILPKLHAIPENCRNYIRLDTFEHNFHSNSEQH